MRPNDFCRLWKNHFEGLRPQTTKRCQMVFAGLRKSLGRPEVFNRKWRPNDFSRPCKNHFVRLVVVVVVVVVVVGGVGVGVGVGVGEGVVVGGEIKRCIRLFDAVRAVLDMFSVRTVRFGYLFSVLAVSVRTVRLFIFGSCGSGSCGSGSCGSGSFGSGAVHGLHESRKMPKARKISERPFL